MDDTQKQVFAIMPWVLMFVMAPFAVGPAGLLDHQPTPRDRPAAVDLPQVPGVEGAAANVSEYVEPERRPRTE
jgi:hypothetical protein